MLIRISHWAVVFVVFNRQWCLEDQAAFRNRQTWCAGTICSRLEVPFRLEVGVVFTLVGLYSGSPFLYHLPGDYSLIRFQRAEVDVWLLRLQLVALLVVWGRAFVFLDALALTGGLMVLYAAVVWLSNIMDPLILLDTYDAPILLWQWQPCKPTTGQPKNILLKEAAWISAGLVLTHFAILKFLLFSGFLRFLGSSCVLEGV